MQIKESGEGFAGIRRALRFLQKNKCYIGIPAANASRDSKGITNVELAFIHSKGSPRLRIPARPFLEPAIEQDAAQQQILRHMKAAAAAAADGNGGGARAELDKAGQAGENAAKDYIGSGNHAPNSGFTLTGGWMRNRISGKPFYAEPKTSAVPLIDTGSLRRSITHVIEEG
ncbi:MAG: hypothetical protein IJZ74_06845 [Clostridia bacterium]|nr:hypothetical protein [Clostridia bacterium]